MLNSWHGDVEAVFSQMVAWRRHLHENPELPFEEEHTARMVGDILAGYRIEVQRNIGGHGVVGILRGKDSGPVIGLRADMDALPIQEENEVPYKSRVPNVMHACGHDAHTAILLGVAKILSNHRERLKGKVVFIFQPAEEEFPGGAIKMIEDGALEGIDVIFGNHVLSSIKLGNISVPKGISTAAIDNFELKIIGKAGHSAMPHIAVNPIVTGVQIVNQLHLLMSQKVDPAEPAVAAVSTFHAGATANAIPRDALISGTIRAFNEAEKSKMEQHFKKIIQNVADTYGAAYELNYSKGYPSIINPEKETAIVKKLISSIKDVNLIEPSPIMASEDFAYYLQKVPGVYFLTGAATENPNTQFSHHHPRFDIDERAMKNSVKALLSIVDYYLIKKDRLPQFSKPN